MDKEGKIKIYLADTDKDEIDKMQLFFADREEYQIVGSANDGESAITGIKELQPDFVIMEVLLGGIDGFKVIETIKKEMKESCPKVIFVSNLSHAGFISKAMKEGADYFMVKPISLENLEERIVDIANNCEIKSNEGEKVLDEKISNIFISIGIPAHIKGYQFLREAVKLAVVEPDIIASITKKLYPTIAEKFSTSSSKVERGMRHAIEVAWNRGKIENINNLFGLKIYGANDKPTNGELIALIADKMIMGG
ncbi:MAG: sporulation transcription factor Spo0A [Clostridiales bacterium]|nr:sporulation transcription factor Spo0A [Clostridiales bacterium]